MNFEIFIFDFVCNTDHTNWSALNCLQYLENHIQFTSDSKQDILDAYIIIFGKVKDSTITNIGSRNKARKLYHNAKETFQRKEIDDFFKDLDQRFETVSELKFLHNVGLTYINFSPVIDAGRAGF